MAERLLVCLIALAFVGSSRADLAVTPFNAVILAGTPTHVLSCSAAAGPTARIMWTEFTSDGVGRVLSDGRTIIASHPNAARYAILGTGLQFDLQISAVELADGGRYLCQDINGAPPALFRGSAELTVLASDPVCEEFSTVTGSIVEGRYYTSECEVAYKGAFAPNMTWTGPGNYDVQETVTETEVWSMTSFTAERTMELGRFQCLTKFVLPPNLPGESATNVPDYEYLFVGVTLVVNWPPQNMVAVPIKDIYYVGDIISCSADSKPASTYRWTNMRTQITNPAGAVFVVTEDLQGYDTVLRCNAIVLLDGSIYTSDIFINVTVPAATVPTGPTTTVTTLPPPADGPCTDLTGHWSSTNPNAHLCIEMDSKGNILTLIRNGTDPFFVAGNGKTQYGDYKHVGFTAIWPVGFGGVGGFTGECHSCFGSEVILLSGLSRNKAANPGCGLSAGTQLTNLYVLTRFGPPCRSPNAPVFRPSAAHIKYMDIKPDQIMR